MAEIVSGTVISPDTVEIKSDTLRFEYEKAVQFRTVHADGAIGGITPRGYIHMAFYAERAPIPKVVVHKITDKGTLGDELLDQRVARKDVFRELEVDVVMDEAAAVSLLEWLTKKVELLKQVKSGSAGND